MLAGDTLQTKNPDIFPGYSTSWQYVGEYAGNMPKLVPNSRDSQVSVSNNRSRSNFLPICRSSHIRRNSTCLNMSTVCRGARTQDSWICRVFSICREYIGNDLAKIASLVLRLVRIYRKYVVICWIYHEYAANISISREYIGLPITNSAVGYFEFEYQGNISASFEYTGNISGYKQTFYTNSAVRYIDYIVLSL